MAARYWVGGTGTWNTTNTTNWSTASGGTGGASVPDTADDVYFDASSGSGTVTIGNSTSVRSFNSTSYTGSFASSSSYEISINGGNLTTGTAGASTQLNQLGFRMMQGGSISTPSRQIRFISIQNNSGTVTLTSNLHAVQSISISTYGSGSFTTSQDIACNNSIYVNTSGSAVVSTGHLIPQSNPYGVFLESTDTSSLTVATVSRLRSVNCAGNSTLTINSVNSTNTSLGITHNSSGTLAVPIPSSGYMSFSYYRTASSGTITGMPSSITSSSEITIGNNGATLSSVGLTDSSASLTVTNGATLSNFSYSGNQLYLDAATGTIGTFIFNHSSTYGGLYLNSDLTVSSLTLSGQSTVYRITVTPNNAVRKKITASSFSLSNIKWINIEAAGTIPFTGTGFEDGGNNLNITFPSLGSGLFFGSNF